MEYSRVVSCLISLTSLSLLPQILFLVFLHLYIVSLYFDIFRILVLLFGLLFRIVVLQFGY